MIIQTSPASPNQRKKEKMSKEIFVSRRKRFDVAFFHFNSLYDIKRKLRTQRQLFLLICGECIHNDVSKDAGSFVAPIPFSFGSV